jgi:hypothetical protein
VRRLAISLAVNAFVPAVLYVALGRDRTALVVGAAVPVGWSIALAIARRRADPVALLSLAGLGVALVVSAATGGSVLPLLLRHVAITGTAGLACLVSLIVGQPLIGVLRGRRDRVFTGLTAIAGTVLVVHAGANVVLALTLSTGRYLVVEHPVGWTILGVGTAVCIVYMRRSRATLAVVGVVFVAAGLTAYATAGPATTRAAAATDEPVAPINGGSGRPVTASPIPLAPAGYLEREYSLSGSATAYTQAGVWGSDGRWAVTATGQAAFRTRLLVRRPANPARFNGTVVVEWLDLPGGRDLDPDFLYESAELLRGGYAWVGVSAQQQGVATLQKLDPGRYADLSHPGDSYSYSIFSEAARALRQPGAVDPLGGLRPTAFIADGYSGSAARMVTYINARQPVDQRFDGFLVHSRWARSAPIDQPSPAVVYTRTDLGVPVLTVETESEIRQTYTAHPALDYTPATQDDSAYFRLWEVPGTSHVDARLDALIAAETGSAPTVCDRPANRGQESEVLDAAVYRLNQWVRTGVPAPSVDRIRLTPDGTAVARDGDGNAVGGLRTPALQAPAATLTGAGNSGVSPQCEIEGTTVPLPGRPPTRAQVAAAVAQDIAAGTLLPADGAKIIADF